MFLWGFFVSFFVVFLMCVCARALACFYVLEGNV